MESVMQTTPRAKGEAISKDPDEWTTGDEPMTPSQASYLKTLCEQAGDDRGYAEDLSKAEASKRIDALRTELKL
ncbi:MULTISPECIES: DUF3072 domain-containing protein [unclassified Mesorhizobium]|uniref:DUF3072 domain-containing protein n=1 Tax=unclassified Mesorhizobium TaxID=325217 RepID=UPI0003CEC401|nr:MULTISPECIES: DUF3072 domain-containing protein [unclassified Mesorhizobium]ESY44930.1 hypothetical protein X745_31735 [Mesorhizobium sp. LNJC374B00]ESY55967.1 hypothetical protein X744_22805 [Mesorhizobium sp. LNJC372A00]WJI81180.1 DUF3072 domain-containing protein [Mesorhizobium sp. C374B]WJI81204.1 DUF3072 domain-containing protein [Mesorhizobium sp. C374B]WJI87723.1 DUF3072 domain-containing protein [Mesorhizobium sp. C372A]